MILVIWIFTILFLLYPILFLFQDSYSLIPLSKWIEYLFKDAAVDFSDWLALYFAVLIGLVGVYFTIVSILLDKKNITPFTCLKHTLFFEDYLLITAIVANTLMALFCFPYIRYTNAVLLYFICGILLIFFLFIKCTYSLVYTDREQKAEKFVRKKIILLLKHNQQLSKKESFNFAYDFIFKCFPDKKFLVLDDVYNQISKHDKGSLKVEKCFCTIISELDEQSLVKEEPDSLNDYVSFITKRLYSLIAKSSENFEEAYALISNYYKKLFEIYKAYLYKKLVRESYLLLLSEPIIYIYKFNLPVVNKDKLMKVFYSLLSECKKLIYISLYHCDFETVRDEIHHYMSFVQFLRLTDEYNDLLNMHDHHLVDICAKICNVVQLDIVGKKYLLLIEPMLNQVRTIEISPVEYEMYDELLPEIGMHEVKYTKAFYITLILFWYYYTKKDMDFILNKIKYVDGKNSEKVWAYKTIISSLEKIDYSDIINFLPEISEEKFNENITVLKTTLFYSEKEENKKIVDNLRKSDYTEKLKNEIEKQKSVFISEFEFMKSKSRKTENVSVEGLTFSFSVAKMNELSEYYQFYFSYYSSLKDFLFANYLRSADIIEISSLTEIKGIKEKTDIMLSRSYNRYFFEQKDLDYFNGDLKIEDKFFSLEFINTVSKLIVLKEDFNASYRLDSVVVQEDKKTEEPKINIRDIFIEVPFKPIFKLTKTRHVAYKLILN